MSENQPLEGTLQARLSRRRWLLAAAATAGAMVAACAPAAPSPTAPPTKPAAEPTKPAAVATSAPAKPAASPAASPGASPAASPAAATGAPLAKAKEMTEVSQVMNWFAQSSHGGFIAGVKNGDYERANLKMTYVQGGPQISAVPLVASGKHQFGMVQADQLLLARQEGIPIVGIFSVFQVNPQALMYHMEQPVKDFPDLNGRKVYVTPTLTMWTYVVAKYHLDKVEQLNYNGQLALFLNDKSAVFQCYVSSEPPAAKKAGANPGTLLFADSGFNPYGNIMVATEQLIKDKPDVVQAYVSASLAGWKSFLDNPAPIMPVIKEYNKDYDTELGLEASRIEKPYILGKSNDLKVLGTITEQRFKELHDQMRQTNMLKQDLDYKAAFNATFIDAAQKG